MQSQPGPGATKEGGGFRRFLFAVLVTGVAALAAGGLIGFAAAGDAPSNVPDHLAILEPRVGDRGAYAHSVLRSTGSSYEIVEPEETFIDFEWLADGQARDEWGGLHATNELYVVGEGVSHRLQGSPPRPLPEVQSYDALTRELLAFRYDSETATGGPGGAPGFVANTSVEERQQLFLRRDALSLMSFCGLRTEAQGTTLDLAEPVVLFRHCERADVWEERPIFKARGAERFGDLETVVFAKDPRRSGTSGALFVWMSPDLAYPVKIAEQRGEDPSLYDVVRLVRFARGAEPLGGASGAGPDLPAPAFAPRQPWGLDESGTTHPFPASAAFAHARHDPSSARLRDFLAAHPHAYAEQARYLEVHEEGFEQRNWRFLLTDGSARFPLGVVQETRSTQPNTYPLPVPPIVPGSTTTYRYNNESIAPSEGSLAPPPDRVPPSLPSLSSLQERWAAYASPAYAGRTPNAWTLTIGCSDDVYPPVACKRVWVFAGAGHSLVRNQRPVHGMLPGESSETYHSVLYVDEEGRSLDLVEYHLKQSETFAPAPAVAEQPDPAALPQAIDVSVWSVPVGRYAVATGLLAVLTGLAYWFWPAIRDHLAGLLFTRLERPHALDHRVRAQLHALIEAEPGIHGEELLRRVARGRGTVQHHLRKLVQLGLVTEHAGQGYTCYFPKGAVDRRLMAAAPVLKADGARRVLASVGARPGSTSLEVARTVGLAPATVSYHLKRLSEVGLVAAERAGKGLRLTLTPLGRQALGEGSAA